MAKKSMRISALTEVDTYDSCETQHCARIPSNVRYRSVSGAFEKKVQMEFIISWRCGGRLSSFFTELRDELRLYVCA